MNEQFRVSQKIGLMFRPGVSLPQDVKSWAISQLNVKSPALGIETVSSKVKEWPKSLQPDLLERDDMFFKFKNNRRKERKKLEGQDSQAAIDANQKNHLLARTDELKFSHRNTYGKDQVKLRFLSFWTNHFTMGNIWDNQNHIGHAMDEAILANFDANFSDMLYKVTSHPSMLIYLDNIWSAGPNSKQVMWAKADGEQAGLNDNLGRELLELHTVSPAANYTETDIRNAAKVLAGWGTYPGLETKQEYIDDAGTLNSWDFFKKNYAEPGNKVVLGKTIYSGKGGLKQLTDFLASHESTITFISSKLAEHFVSDNASSADVNYIADAWRKNNGNLKKIHTAVIERAILSKEPKFQWPMNWLFQVVRLSEATFFHGWHKISDYYDDHLMNNDKIFAELGQGFWLSRQPDGFSSNKNEWLSGEMFERRIRFSEAIYRAGRPNILADEIMDRIGANMATRNLVNNAGNQRNKFIALMCSPELMGLENA